MTSSSVEPMPDQAASPSDDEYDEPEPSLDHMREQALILRAELLAMVRELEDWDRLVERRMNSRKHKTK